MSKLIIYTKIRNVKNEKEDEDELLLELNEKFPKYILMKIS